MDTPGGTTTGVAAPSAANGSVSNGSHAPGVSVAVDGGKGPAASSGHHKPSLVAVDTTPSAAKKRLRRGSEGAADGSADGVGSDLSGATGRAVSGIVSTFVNVACLYRILARRDRENPLFLARSCRSAPLSWPCIAAFVAVCIALCAVGHWEAAGLGPHGSRW